ncbi:MAG: hypothetical protein WKG07_29355 [Hymenobacter sp.]
MREQVDAVAAAAIVPRGPRSLGGPARPGCSASTAAFSAAGSRAGQRLRRATSCWRSWHTGTCGCLAAGIGLMLGLIGPEVGVPGVALACLGTAGGRAAGTPRAGHRAVRRAVSGCCWPAVRQLPARPGRRRRRAEAAPRGLLRNFAKPGRPRARWLHLFGHH